MTEKRKRGRPSDYRPEYCDLVIERAKEGKSLESFAAHINTSRTSLFRWRQEYPEFEEAVQIAKLHQLDWWENRALEIASGEIKGNHVLVIFALKNVGSDTWKDRQEVNVTNNPVAEAMDYFDDDDD